MAFKGKTYSLFGNNASTDRYCRVVKELTDVFLRQCPDENQLLFQIQKASRYTSPASKLSERKADKLLVSFIKSTLTETLSIYTADVRKHLRTLPLSKRFDAILRTREYQYHLYMIEIELVNRIYREAFKASNYKFALIAHCLRDFRPDCRSVSGDIDFLCRRCTKECFINLGSVLLKKYNINPYISVEMDLEKLFKKIRDEHESTGALGIACVPELVHGMRLCIKLDIPPVGIPLDANRCARWMKKAHESSFNLKELENLLK
ncbi:MAG: DUF116 domain-containing protein [Thermodesulfovibrionia bacterium]